MTTRTIRLSAVDEALAAHIDAGGHLVGIAGHLLDHVASRLGDLPRRSWTIYLDSGDDLIAVTDSRAFAVWAARFSGVEAVLTLPGTVDAADIAKTLDFDSAAGTEQLVIVPRGKDGLRRIPYLLAPFIKHDETETSEPAEEDTAPTITLAELAAIARRAYQLGAAGSEPATLRVAIRETIETINLAEPASTPVSP